MIDNPVIGQECFILVDIWETLCPASVKIISINRRTGSIAAKWEITDNFVEIYKNLRNDDLFESEEEAREANNADRMQTKTNNDMQMEEACTHQNT